MRHQIASNRTILWLSAFFIAGVIVMLVVGDANGFNNTYLGVK